MGDTIANASQARLDEALSEIELLRERVRDLERANALQAEEIRIMRLREHGRGSERMSDEDRRQGLLFDEAELHSVAPAEAMPTETVRIVKTTYVRRKPGRKPLSNALSRIEQVIDLSDEEKKVDEGCELVRIGEETSEQVHEIPQKYIVIRTVRPKYVVRRCDSEDGAEPTELRIAGLPPRILPRSIATPSLLASVLVGKFCDGLPFYRQERIFARHRLEISRQDMANWAMAVAPKLEGLLGLMRLELLASSYLHRDETFFQVMDEPGRSNTTQSYMWVTTSGSGERRVVLYQYSRTRSSSFVNDFLDSYSGFLQTDGYDGYNAIGEKEGIVHVGCWAHARRRFVEAHKVSGGEGSAMQAITLIAKLYEIEGRLRKKHFGDGAARDVEAFGAERREETGPAMAVIKDWLDAKALAVPPQMALGKAVSYALDQWPRLVRYPECPYLTPDNNEAERAIRPFTIGRKNWVISGSPRGAFASATLYSFIETAKANGLEPYYYLRYVLTTLPTTTDAALPGLLPWNLPRNAFDALTVEDARLSLNSIPMD
jgi:transposase